jgi:rhodanese-related sulfurtransferase
MSSVSNTRRVKSIKVNDLGTVLDKINLIDIREAFEYRTGHLPGAKNIPMEDLLYEPEEFMNKDKEYHLICRSGRRSLMACNELVKKGYKVTNVAEGTMAYKGELER